MVSIFRPTLARTGLLFETRGAYVPFEAELDFLTGAETITVAFSSGAPFSLTAPAGPVTPAAFVSAVQADIDAAVGAGVGLITQVDDSSFILSDVADVSITISDSLNSDERLMIPNITRVTGASSADGTPDIVGDLVEYEGLGFPLNTLTERLTIPPGITDLTVWLELESNDDQDGYETGCLYALAWDNGTDGIVTSGFITELVLEPQMLEPIAGNAGTIVVNGITPFPIQVATTTAVSGSSSSMISGNTTLRTANKVQVPRGATGFRLLIIQYAQVTQPLAKTPPTFRAWVTGGTR